VLIADLTNTVSRDQAGAEALLRAYHRALVSGTHLRVAVAAAAVRQVLETSGIDRLLPTYPSMDAALAAGPPTASDLPGPPRDARQPRPSGAGAITGAGAEELLR
jgi:hypothetical protein